MKLFEFSNNLNNYSKSKFSEQNGTGYELQIFVPTY